MSVELLTHLGICVSDLERSVAFYRDVFGFEEKGRLVPDSVSTSRLIELPDADLHAVYLERDGWRIELLAFPEKGVTGPGLDAPRALNQLGLTHLSFRVRDFDAFLDRVKAAGGRVLEGGRIDIRGGLGGVVFVTDPDGMKIEVIEAPGDPSALPGSG